MPAPHVKRFVIGGLGGLAPVIALLVAVDFEKNYVNASNAQVAGYAVRTIALFAIGGFVAWLHESEVHNFKIFEIGLGAPALIAGFVTSQSLAHAPLPKPASDAQPRTSISWILLPQAHAQPPAIPASAAPGAKAPTPTVVGVVRGPDGTPIPLKTFTFPEPSNAAAFWEGFAGVRVRPKDVYYVITGSSTKQDDAIDLASRINKTTPDLPAAVYKPFGTNPHWAVVIGERASLEEAQDIRRRAISQGLAADTYLWTPPGYR